jgi:hypothetical protein
MKCQRPLQSVFKALVVFTLAAASIQASVIYNFVGTGTAIPGPAEPVAFQLTVPTFVNPPLTNPPNPAIFVFFFCAQMDSSTNCNSSIAPPALGAIDFSNQGALGAFSAQIGFQAANFASYAFFFPTGAFGTPGVYTTEATVSNPGTLTVTSIPEPSTMLLTLSGICLWSFPRFRTRR